DWDGAPTTVNGQAFVDVNGVTGDFAIDLAGGNNLFYAAGVAVPGELNVSTGQGNDIVVLSGVAVAGSSAGGSGSIIQTGAGDDLVYLPGSSFPGPLGGNPRGGGEHLLCRGG